MGKIKCTFPGWKHTILKPKDILQPGDYCNEWDRVNRDWYDIGGDYIGGTVESVGYSYQIFIRPVRKFPNFN